MFEVSGSEALAIANKNPTRAWNAKKFNDGFFEINHISKFKILPDEPIFTMGSCFAREVENNLTKLKYSLVTQDYGIEPEFYDTWNEEKGTGGGVMRGKLSRGAFNKYTVASMTNEIRRVLLNEQYENNGLIEVQPGQWFDPHASGLKAGPFEVVSGLRDRIASGIAQIRKAKVIFLTLGLVEGWVDAMTGLSLVRPPTGRALVRLADRFKLVRPSYTEALADLEENIALIREHCDPGMRFVITVSPVPFHATFRPLDVVTANTLSKSLLRTLADEISEKYDYVDYFPSYELVTNSPRNIAWKDDMLHVERNMVSHVMKTFSAAYMENIE
ncbi:GSCFA domain-containing protein [Sabulicella glaciei]|uniref:GSCFA domain-containing protein n=1 Tax=Sabulicella glaciei TaxID=2984948 RepID=UPI00265AF91B